MIHHLEPNVIERIARAKRELERMIDLTPRAVMLTDSNGRIRRANRPLLEMLKLGGFPELLGRPFYLLFAVPECGMTAFLAQCRSAPDHPGIYSRTLTVALPNRGPSALDFSVIPSGDSRRGDYMIVVECLNGDHRTSALFEDEQDPITLRQVVAGLLHTLNQPLTVIMANAWLILSELENFETARDAVAADATIIIEMARRIQSVLDRGRRLEDFVLLNHSDRTPILQLEPTP